MMHMCKECKDGERDVPALVRVRGTYQRSTDPKPRRYNEWVCADHYLMLCEDGAVLDVMEVVPDETV